MQLASNVGRVFERVFSEFPNTRFPNRIMGNGATTPACEHVTLDESSITQAEQKSCDALWAEMEACCRKVMLSEFVAGVHHAPFHFAHACRPRFLGLSTPTDKEEATGYGGHGGVFPETSSHCLPDSSPPTLMLDTGASRY